MPLPLATSAPQTQKQTVPFNCEACELKYEVDNPRPLESISCPNCNARYLYWPQGRAFGATSDWKCVVKPISA